MQKDLKIGMVLGLVLAAAIAVWLSTLPCLSTKARMLQHSRPAASLHPHNDASQQESIEQSHLAPNTPNTPP